MGNKIAIKEIVNGLRLLVRAVYTDSADFNKQFGLTVAQSGVLRTLVSSGPISSAELSRRLYVTPANITGIIDRLGKKGLVVRTRKEGDRRIALINLTERGKALSEALPDPLEMKLVSGLANLTADQIFGLHSALNQILKLINARGTEDTPLDLISKLELDSPAGN